MSTPSTPRTPIKALHSSLTARSSPTTVPPASSSYEPQVEGIIQARLANVYAYSLIASLGVSFGWHVWQRGGPWAVGLGGMVTMMFGWWTTGIWTILGAFALWGAACVPILMGRKAWMSSDRTLSPSPRLTFKAALGKKSTEPALVAYVASALAFTFTHAAFASCLESDAKLGPFVKSRKHPQYLNPRLLFLLISQGTLAAVYLFRNLLRDRFAFRFDARPSPPLPIIAILASIVATATASTALPLAALIFGLARIFVVPVLFNIPILGAILKIFGGHFLRGPYTLSLAVTHLPLVIRAWFLAATTAFLWEAAECMFDGVLAESVHLTLSNAKTNATANQTLLISGLTSSALPTKFRALSELQCVLSGTSPRAQTERQVLYGGDTNKGGPNLWSVMVKESLAILDDELGTLKRRGAPKPAAKPAVSTTPASKAQLLEGLEERVHATPTPLLRRSIIRGAPPLATPPPIKKESIREVALDTIGSDGPLATLVDRSAGAIPNLFKSVSGTPMGESLFRPAATPTKSPKSIEKPAPAPPPPTSFVSGLVKKSRAAACKKVRGAFDKYAPLWAREAVYENAAALEKWWTRPRVDKLVEVSLGAGKTVSAAVVDVLSRLICHSLTEDRYGVVQRDIPRILEAFVESLIAVEEYQAEVQRKYTPAADAALLDAQPTEDAGEGGNEDPPSQANGSGSVAKPLTKEERKARREKRAAQEELDRAVEALEGVASVYKDALARVTRTFGPKLEAFKFAPRVRAKLGQFRDGCV